MIRFPPSESLLTRRQLAELAFTSLGHFINDGTDFLIPLIAAILVAQRGLLPLDVTGIFITYYELRPWQAST
jgi:hypothetical protein